MKLFSSATRGVIFGSVLGWAFTWILSLALLVLSFAVFPAAPPFWLHLLLFSFLCFIVPALAGVACGLWGARIAKRQMHSEWTQIAATELSRLETPATILISLASSYLLMLLLALLGTILMRVRDEPGGFQQWSHEQFAEQIGFNALLIAITAFILLGAIRMKNGRSYWLAMAAAILSVFPCCATSPWILLGVPFGIWAFVVLLDPSVKSAFRSSANEPELLAPH